MLQHSILPPGTREDRGLVTGTAPQTESLMCFGIKWGEETRSMASALTDYPDFRVLAQTTEFLDVSF